MNLNVYVHFNGDCEEAFKFYEKTLGARIESVTRFEGSPAAKETPPNWAQKILHGRIVIGDEVVMASDAPPGRYSKPQGFFVSLSVKEPDEAERLFKSLSEGGNIWFPIQETFWASRFAMLADRFGIPWMINCEKK